MTRANCDNCGEDHTADYKDAEVKLAKRHKQFTLLFLFCVGLAVGGAWTVHTGFATWTAAVFGIYFSYVNLASIDHGRTLVAKTLADMAKAGKMGNPSDLDSGGGNYL